MTDQSKSNAAVMDRPSGTKNLVDTAIQDGRFKTLFTALQAAGLVETLKGTGPFTVFAPTDAAFSALSPGMLDGLLKDKAKLTSLLKYHVVPGNLRAADLKPLADKDGMISSKSVEGHPIELHVDGGKVRLGRDKKIQVIQADVPASNGVIHVIDGILTLPK